MSEILNLNERRREELEEEARQLCASAETEEQLAAIVNDHLAAGSPRNQPYLTIFLRLATYRGYTSIIPTLLKSGAEIDQLSIYNAARRGSTTTSITILQAFLDNGWGVNTRLKFAGDAMWQAVERDDEVLVKWLLDHGAHHSGNEGTDRLLAVAHAATHASPEIISLLVRAGAKIGRTRALELAAKAGKLNNVVRLLELGAPVDEIAEPEDWLVSGEEAEKGVGTALHAAAESGHKKIVQVLLEHGARIGLPDTKGFTPLDRAARAKNKEIVKLLETAESV